MKPRDSKPSSRKPSNVLDEDLFEPLMPETPQRSPSPDPEEVDKSVSDDDQH